MRARTAMLFSAPLLALLADACSDAGPSEPAKAPVPTVTAVSPLTQEGTVNQFVASKPTVLVTDAGGRPVAGIIVVFNVQGPALPSITTGADGIASTEWRLSQVAGTQTLVATLYSAKMVALGPSVAFTAIGRADSLAGIYAYAFPIQAGFSSTSVMKPPVIVAVDQYSNPKPGVQLTFEVTGGSVVAPASATTDSAGRAGVASWTLGSSVGTDTLIARAQGVSPIYLTVPVVEPFVVSGIVTGYQHTCALSQGDVYCWGNNDVGQVTPADPGSATFIPHRVPLGVKAVSLASGYNHTCAISNESPPQAYCWGDNSTGQLGVRTPGYGPFRVPVADGLASVATGAGHTCGLTPGGVAYCWGNGTDGQLGNGAIFACLVSINGGTTCPGPQPVGGDFHFASITAGDSHSCGLVADGTLYCWGLNAESQLGSPSASPCVETDYYYGTSTAVACALLPQVVPNMPAFSNVAAAGYATCAVATAGPVWCFRWTGRNQLSSTRTVATLSSDGSCALGAGGDAFCWLAGFDVPSASLTQPANLFSGTAFTAITAAQRHRCGILKSNGAAVCWGNNDEGQLGSATGGGLVPFPVVVPP
jgi:alpha-tubulin suppressor-like RCC1 family protein